MISINTEYFRQEAKFFEKHRRYDDGVFDTYEYHEFWDRERDRCLNGYEVGGMKITGDHYYYLNYTPIMKVSVNHSSDGLYGEVFKSKTDKIAGERIKGFPDFWDEDWNVYNELELARINGQHFVWLKPRGAGASWKGSSRAGKNFFLYPESKTYMIAYTSEFLLGDGLFTKFLANRQFINSPHPDEKRYLTAFGKPSDYKKDINDMHFRASSNIDGEERGYMSEVMGISYKDDIDKIRGKRGRLIMVEELGAAPNADTVFNVLRSSVEQGGVTFGQIVGFGTGGSEAAKFGSLEKIFYAPQAYNVRFYENIYDEGLKGTNCAYFTPAFRNIGFKDAKGNSDEKTAKLHFEKERENAAKSPDGNALIQIKSEHPFTPQEAILRNTHTPLPANEAIEWYHRVINLGYHKMGLPGRIVNTGERLDFKPDDTLQPIDKFPHDKKNNLDGCVVQYFSPFKVAGRVPDDLYIIAHDPYAFDQSTDSESLGAAYVYMQPNNITPPGDKIVATYFGRPKTMDDYNKILFDLAQYYNAKIGFENDRGDVIGYAKRFKKLDWLADEFELAFDADLPKSKTRRQFGMHIGSGKENLRMHKGNKYLSDWLIGTRGVDEDDRPRLNLHTIYCPATLQEIYQYRLEGGNFDRISALRILAYYQKELVYRDINPSTHGESTSGSFFNRKLF